MGCFPSASICGRPLCAGCVFIGSRELIFSWKKLSGNLKSMPKPWPWHSHAFIPANSSTNGSSDSSLSGPSRAGGSGMDQCNLQSIQHFSVLAWEMIKLFLRLARAWAANTSAKASKMRFPLPCHKELLYQENLCNVQTLRFTWAT